MKQFIRVLSYRGHRVAASCKALQLTWLFIIGYAAGSALAQTAPITSSGLNTQINLSSTPPAGKVQHDITGGTRPGNGPNLFHSFGEFDVPSNHIANFLNETKLPTTNILARVTGGHTSDIFGTIRTQDFGNANLFLLNPKGFVFGPTATLYVSGSVAFTSADYLKLGDTVRFNAIPNIGADALLSSAPVASFGFLGSNPGTIEVHGSQLSVRDGQQISFIGGNIAIQSGPPNGESTQAARLVSRNGTIFLASTTSAGELNAATFEPSPNINGRSFDSYGSLSLAPDSSIDVHGTHTVSIRGGQFLLSVNDAVLTTTTSPTSRNTLSLSQESSILTTNLHTGRGADIEIITGALHMKDLAKIVNRTSGPGDAGGIRIQAHENITLLDSDINSSAFDSGLGAGNAGQIWLSAPTITLQHGNVISLSQGSGNAGEIILETKDLTIGSNTVGAGTVLSSESIGPGIGGNITIRGLDGPGHRAGDVTIAGESVVTSTTSGKERGGHINVLTERMALTNRSSLRANSGALGAGGNIGIDAAQSVQVSSSSTLESIAGDSGNAGEISIMTPNLIISDNGRISTSTISTGNAGTIAIGATSINLLRGGLISSNSSVAGPGAPSPTGSAGAVFVKGLAGPADVMLIDGSPSGILTNTEGTGPGGTINLSARSLTIRNGGTLSASTTGTEPSATGGSIIVNAADQVTLASGASMTASTSGPGNAGNLVLKTNSIALSGGADITASSTGTGNAGTVTIQRLQGSASAFLIDGVESGIFTKTSNTGAGGTIFVEGDKIRLTNGALVASSSTGGGSGGNITLAARQSVSILDGATVSSSSSGLGNAGSISINAGKQLAVERGSITTQSTKLNGGNITIQASDLVRIVDGKISTSALTGGGNGGNISIDPKVVLLQNSEVLAQAKDGNGGRISISTPLYLKDQSSLVSADSQFGVNGTVTIQSPISNVSSTVGQLVSKTSPPQILLQNRCVVLAGGDQSTFLLSGREALPLEPGGWLSSPVSMGHWTGEEAEYASGFMAQNRGVNASPTAASQKSTPATLSLRRLTPPGFLVRTFATGTTGCPS